MNSQGMLDASVSQMLPPEIEAELGLLGRFPDQVVCRMATKLTDLLAERERDQWKESADSLRGHLKDAQDAAVAWAERFYAAEAERDALRERVRVLDSLGKRLCALVPAVMDALESDSELDARRAAFESVQDFFDDPEAQKWHPQQAEPAPEKER